MYIIKNKVMCQTHLKKYYSTYAKIMQKLTQNSKNKCVGEVSMQGEFDQVALDAKSTSGLDQ